MKDFDRLMARTANCLESGKVDLWMGPASDNTRVGLHCHMFVRHSHMTTMEAILTDLHLDFEIKINNVQELVDEQYACILDKTFVQHAGRVRRSAQKRTIPDYIIGNYVNYTTTMKWLEELEQLYDIVKLEVIGKSREGRDIVVVKIGMGNVGGIIKEAVWIDGTVHGNEWIVPATINYIIHQLLSSYVHQDENLALLEELNWYILPIVNPDGYQYTFDHDRLWRKNRNWSSWTHGYKNGKKCVGTDINRNFPFQWGTKMNSGEDGPCQSKYRGPQAASELESRAIMSFVYAHRDHIRAFLTVHSYSQVILTRFAYADVVPDDHDELCRVGRLMTDAICSDNLANYTFGTAPQLLYSYSGGSPDWAKSIGIQYAYTIELRDRGHFGFFLPSNYTVVVGSEILAGLRVLGRELIQTNSASDVTEPAALKMVSFSLVFILVGSY